jgi:hypothetical protein
LTRPASKRFVDRNPGRAKIEIHIPPYSPAFFELASLEGSNMDERLAHLISDYQGAVGTALRLMAESGIDVPENCREWVDMNIPINGKLIGGTKYYKHGYGCEVHLLEGSVDFDFGTRGEVDGFDAWRLWKFSSKRPLKYEFETYDAITSSICDAIKQRFLVRSEYGLHYVVDSHKSVTYEMHKTLGKRFPLPHSSRDCVQTLSSQCFESADVMREHFQRLNRLWRKDRRLSNSNMIKIRVYLMSWLGYLRSTAEGFKELQVRALMEHRRPEEFQELINECDAIKRLETQHGEDLRKLRNHIFHLRSDNEDVEQFFSDDGTRMKWAAELHAAFASFFSSYRVLCEVHCVVNGRLGESLIRQESAARRKRKAQKSMPALEPM